MGTIQKSFNSIFGKKTAKKTTSTVKPERIPDSEWLSFSPRATAKNNRKRTRGRKFRYQLLDKPNKKGKMAIKHIENEVY